MDQSRLTFLAELPLLLGSALSAQHVMRVALKHLKDRLAAEAATLFLLTPGTNELTFWAIQGGGELAGKRISASKGIVGWVLQHQESVQVDDVQADPRFFRQVDDESKFETKNLICVPLTVRGSDKLGAIQVLNATAGHFGPDDLKFTEQFGRHIALALDNAQLYEASVERARLLERLDKRKSEMITVIAHEFRTPLNLIQTAADVLAEASDGAAPARAKMVEVMRRGVERLTKLVADVRALQVLDPSRQALEVKPESIPVKQLLNRITKLFDPSRTKRKLTLLVEVPSDTMTIFADEPLMTTLIRNLVSNAVRATADGGTITLSATQSLGLIEIAISDTGIGIAEQDKKAIFEKFYEVTAVLEHSSGEYEFGSCGLGLGLPTAQAIAEAHGSTITVESELKKGSRFAVRLQAA